jgi:hypothetical protein
MLVLESAAHTVLPSTPQLNRYTGVLGATEYSEEFSLPLDVHEGALVLPLQYMPRPDLPIHIVTFDDNNHCDVLPVPCSFLHALHAAVVVPIAWLPAEYSALCVEYTPVRRQHPSA